MITTVITPVALVDQAGERENQDRLHGTGTNRKEDKVPEAAGGLPRGAGSAVADRVEL